MNFKKPAVYIPDLELDEEDLVAIDAEAISKVNAPVINGEISYSLLHSTASHTSYYGTDRTVMLFKYPITNTSRSFRCKS